MTSQSRTLTNHIKIGKLDIPGRMMKAATNEGFCSPEGFVTDGLIEFHAKVAAGGVPLQVLGASYFSSESKQARTKQNACDSDEKIEGMRRLSAAVHAKGGKIFGQPNHPGRQCLPDAIGLKYAQAPSAVFDSTMKTMPKAMTHAEIKKVVQDWAVGAERYQKGDFDGIELHCSQGYLLASFLTPYTNRRTDEYGGSFDNRMRILLEVYRAIRERVGSDFPIIMKMNGHDEFGDKGLMTFDLVRVAKRMEEEGLDGVEITTGHYQSGMKGFRGNWDGFFKENVTNGVGQNLSFFRRQGMKTAGPFLDWVFRNYISGYSEGFTLDYAAEFKRALNIPVIATGGFLHKDIMNDAISSERCDMVGVARALIANPNLFNDFKTQEQGPECVFCNRCLARATVHPLSCVHPKVQNLIVRT